jgi:hypothetical protein
MYSPHDILYAKPACYLCSLLLFIMYTFYGGVISISRCDGAERMEENQ